MDQVLEYIAENVVAMLHVLVSLVFARAYEAETLIIHATDEKST
jgi:acetolactate synthase small subunit